MPFGASPPWTRGDRLAQLGIVLWALGFALFRLWLSPSIGTDDAELVVLNDGLRLSYHDTRPPLHDWLVWLGSQAFGHKLWMLVALKYLLLTGAFLHLHAAARRLGLGTMGSAAALLGFAFYYHLVYGLHVGYGNTLSLLYCLCASLHLVLAMSGTRHTWQYLLLGVVSAAGLLAKQSFALYLPALAVAIWMTPALRPILRDRRILLTATLGIALAAPWLIWLFQQPEMLNYEKGLIPKKAGALELRLLAILKVVEIVAIFGGAMLLPAALLLPAAWRARGKETVPENARQAMRFTLSLVVSGLVFLLVFAVATGSVWLQDRHMHALLFALPLLLFTALTALGRPFLGRRPIERLYLAATGLALLASIGGVWWAFRAGPPDCGKCRTQKPLVEMAEALVERGVGDGTLVSADEYVAAQTKSLTPGLRLYLSRYPFFQPEPAPQGRQGPCYLLWQEGLSERRIEELRRTAEQARGEPLEELPAGERLAFVTPADGETVYAWYLAELPPAGDCR